jgi:hypothetical protein
MAYMLQAFKLTPEGSLVGRFVTIQKWETDTVFDVDMSDYIAVKKFLSNMKINGKPLPRKSQYGHIVAYKFWKSGNVQENYFPGKGTDGKKRYLLHYGQLYPVINQGQQHR